MADPAGASSTRPAPEAAHPARPDRPDRPVGGTGVPGERPNGTRPAGPDATETPRSPGSGTAWTPLPRTWAPSPAEPPREALSTAVPGHRAGQEAEPAWTPTTRVRQSPSEEPAQSSRASSAAPVRGGFPEQDGQSRRRSTTAPVRGGSPEENAQSLWTSTTAPVRPESSEEDARPAWTPTAPVRHPEADGPDVSEAARVPRPAGAPEAVPRRPGPVAPDPAFSWSAPMTPGAAPRATRPVVRFARPEGYRDLPRTRRSRTVAAAACVVLGLGLIGGAVTGSWLVGDTAEAGERGTYATAGGLWHNVPVDQLFPPTVDGQGAGPGGADRTWTRIAVAPDGGCADAFDPLLLKTLAPVGCTRLLRATYTDATQSYVTTVGLLFTKADAAGMRALDARFEEEALAGRTDLIPRPYAAKDTVAAAFGDQQRASWTISVLTDAPVVVYAVSGWADGRTVTTPQPAAQATASGGTNDPAQAGLGHEAKGLADRIERALRRTAVSPSEQPS
ncbi:hypothetical protein [Streptomyces sp. NPDC059894]|uniref:hypothetical protein n=1 Tax=unclassified Streptomyces TaxID=2593676 RepID=UPI00365E4AA5